MAGEDGIRLPQVNVVTIGHIDHGKSTLIGRLIYDAGQLKPDRIEEIKSVLKKLNKEKFEYAFILDTFQEEREGEMTIDTVQIPFIGRKYMYNFIDCPGHKEFVKNMISGASYGEMAMFVVSAKPGEGVQSQSREHAWLAKKMGVESMVVAVNKMDTVNYDKKKFDVIVSDIKSMLSTMGYDIENIPFIPVSAMEGDNVSKKSENMGWYTGATLTEALDRHAVVSVPPAGKPLRIPVQDSYEINGEKVVVGRVESGRLKVGDEVVVKPSGEAGIVKSINMWNKEKSEAIAGENIGFTLSNISNIKRGDVVGNTAAVPNASNAFVAEVFILEENGRLVSGKNYMVRCGTAHVQCRAERILNKIDPRSGMATERNAESLEADDAGIVRFVAAEPLVVEKQSDIPQLGRILVRDTGTTIAVGVVTETG